MKCLGQAFSLEGFGAWGVPEGFGDGSKSAELGFSGLWWATVWAECPGTLGGVGSGCLGLGVPPRGGQAVRVICWD